MPCAVSDRCFTVLFLAETGQRGGRYGLPLHRGSGFSVHAKGEQARNGRKASRALAGS